MILRKFIAFGLVPALLWASMGFSISRHYCLGMLVEEHLYHSTEVCESKPTMSSCHSESHSQNKAGHCQSETKGCCENIWLQIEGIDVLGFADEKLAFSAKQNEFKAQTSFSQLLPINIGLKQTIPLIDFVFLERSKAVQQYLAEIQRYLI